MIKKQKIEADIIENEKVLSGKLGLFYKMINDIKDFRKSKKNALKSICKIDEIQELLRSLKVEKVTVKSSNSSSIDKNKYLNNLSVIIGLLKQFKVFL